MARSLRDYFHKKKIRKLKSTYMKILHEYFTIICIVKHALLRQQDAFIQFYRPDMSKYKV